MRPSWFPDWRGQTCAVVGAGESATPEALEELRGRCRVIVINTSYQLAPWADVLYACDDRWWRSYPEAATEFAGLKITQDEIAAKRLGIYRVQLVEQTAKDADAIHIREDFRIGRGSNSGFQAVNLAVLFGVRRILALLDYRGGHWHDDHASPLTNPRPQSLEKWARTLDAQEPTLKALGVELIDVASGGALTAFRKMTIKDALR